MGFSTLDYIVLALYLTGVTVFGTLFRKTQHSVKDYFLGSRNTHWLVISASIVATETSSLTLIGVPAIAYGTYAHPEQGGSLTYLQVVIGYIVARVIISFLFIPAYFQGDLLTAYELLQRRFGTRAKHFAASLFVITRAFADGVRVFAASLVAAAVIGSSLPNFPDLWFWSVVIVGALTLVYTFEGGVAAVIWTDLVQLVVYVTGSLLAAWKLLEMIPGGWATVVTHAEAANKFQIWSFSWDLRLPFTFWAGLAGGTFLTMASHGTDQLLVQRLLTCRNKRDSQKALIASGFMVLFQFALFLLVGVMLYAYYQHAPLPALTTNDEIFPAFIVAHLPRGLAGLMIAAVFAAAMSTMSGSLNSLASTTVFDFYKPLVGRPIDDSRLLLIARWCTAGWGIVLILIALAARDWGSVFTTGLSIASLVYGPMLGAFLLGVLTRRANEPGVMTGIAASLGCMVLVWFFTPLAWTWYVLVGTMICVVVGYTTSLLVPGATPKSASQAG
ncbi:MAG: sodium:solute symporter [Acidobacteria bacterium]|nr:MAG: sodium:solute symporter [Acidobacteriota bacterium]RPJ76753.1 MAG: sodium:solute symporter [Acidobacteriota bacterium]